MILQKTIDECLNLDIVQVIGQYVDLKRSGSNYSGLSPFTSERTASFMVSPSKGIFKDFSSGKGGNLIQFIMEQETLSFPEAVRFLCNNYQIEFLETEKTDEEKSLELEKEGIHLINVFANSYFVEKLNSTPGALDYLNKTRGISNEYINKFGIGFSGSSSSELASRIIDNKFSWQIAVKASIISYKDNKLFDRYRSRITFPIKSPTGNIIGFGGRYVGTKEKVAKYINSSDSIVYNKSMVLYGIFEAKKSITAKDKVYLVEGYLDVVQFHQRGIENTISTSGTAITKEQASLIKRFTKNVVIIFDSDKAGINSMIRGFDVLISEGLNVSVAILPEGQDPDSFAKSKTEVEIEDYIKSNVKDFMVFKYHHLIDGQEDNLSKKSEVITEICRTISLMPDLVKREVYLRQLSKMVDIDINSIRGMSFSTEQSEDFLLQTIEVDPSVLRYRDYIKEQCEKRLAQYILVYGEKTYSFESKVFNEQGKVVSVFIQNLVKKEIFDAIYSDGIQFKNPIYNIILENSIKSDLSDFESFKANLQDDVKLVCENLFVEEIEAVKNDFVGKDSKISLILTESTETSIPRSISETILFYRSIAIEELIEEEVNKPDPDNSTISEYIDLLTRIRSSLNIV